MNDENNSVSSFLNEITEKTPDIFKEEVKAEEEVVVEEEKEEKALPFHKDPKILRFIEKEVAKRAESFKPSMEQQFREEVKDINLPASFVKLVGNDTPEKMEVLKDLSKYFGTLKGEARQEFLAEMKQQDEQAKQEDEAALNELTSGFEQIEEDYGVDLETDTKTRASFIEYLRKVSPKNEDGEVSQFADIPATWETFQEANKPVSKPSRAKELASRGLARSSDAPDQATRPKSWRDVDKFIASLKN